MATMATMATMADHMSPCGFCTSPRESEIGPSRTAKSCKIMCEAAYARLASTTLKISTFSHHFNDLRYSGQANFHC
jgi:hypothetical protein